MNIGIIGTGNLGSILGQLFVKGMHRVMFTSRYDHDRLHTFADAIGENAYYGSLTETLNFADVHLVTSPFMELQYLSDEIGRFTNGKLLIITASPYSKGKKIIQESGLTLDRQRAYVNSLFPDAYIARAFYSHSYIDLREKAFQVFDENKLTVPFNCSNPEVKQIVENLIHHLGFHSEFIAEPIPISVVKQKLRTSPFSEKKESDVRNKNKQNEYLIRSSAESRSVGKFLP